MCSTGIMCVKRVECIVGTIVKRVVRIVGTIGIIRLMGIFLRIPRLMRSGLSTLRLRVG